MFDTIAAISSGNINQPISIIRISGPEAFEIVKKIFSGKIGQDKCITYGYIKDNFEKFDEVLVSWFWAPNSFTGENIVEINAHGGIVNTNRILSLILAHGVRLAEPGEFTRRAFLNGKLDLIKAEAIHDLIFAKTEDQTKLAVKKFDGQTSELIENLKTNLINIIATIETNIDYPEYDDVEQLTQKILLPKLKEVKEQILEILDCSKTSKYIYEGISVVIVGRPNVGKSSLLNALLNEDKAIVTDVPGTTRDIVEGQIQIGQILLNLKDTAGIHQTADVVEKIGIQKSLKQVEMADLIIHLIDPLMSENEDDVLLKQICQNKKYLKVFNKSDLSLKKDAISISAKNNQINPLLEAIKKMFQNIDLNNSKIINNIRQLSLIKSSLISIEEAIEGLENMIGPEVVIIDIQKAWENLANVLGQAHHSDLLDTMFKTFCLGK